MQVEKRKRVDDGEAADRKKGRVRKGDDGVKVEVPAYEEVEEFFVRVRRMQVALEYFKKRKGRQLTAASWIQLLERVDFGRVNTVERVTVNEVDLDLNSDPVNEIESGKMPDLGYKFEPKGFDQCYSCE